MDGRTSNGTDSKKKNILKHTKDRKLWSTMHDQRCPEGTRRRRFAFATKAIFLQLQYLVTIYVKYTSFDRFLRVGEDETISEYWLWSL